MTQKLFTTVDVNNYKNAKKNKILNIFNNTMPKRLLTLPTPPNIDQVHQIDQNEIKQRNEIKEVYTPDELDLIHQEKEKERESLKYEYEEIFTPAELELIRKQNEKIRLEKEKEEEVKPTAEELEKISEDQMKRSVPYLPILKQNDLLKLSEATDLSFNYTGFVLNLKTVKYKNNHNDKTFEVYVFEFLNSSEVDMHTFTTNLKEFRKLLESPISKGYLNTINLKTFPVIKDFINFFVPEERWRLVKKDGK